MRIDFRRLRNDSSAKQRRGVECVEVAVSLPLLLLVLFATMQVCHRIHVSKMLHLATYEAVRAGGSFDGSLVLAQKVFDDRVTAFGIEGATLRVSSGFGDAKIGDRITAESDAPASNNSLPLPLKLSLSNVIDGGKVMYLKEGSQGR